MATLKAVMTSAEQDQKMALDALNATYDIANAQVDAAKKPSKLSGYFSFGKTDQVRPSEVSHANSSSKSQYLANGIMRAHVIKAECSLQMAILQLLQESIVNYVKFGLNLRRAYNSYNIVWQEYKKMGSEFKKHMDKHTVSGVQFGIGSVHLVLSVLPAKALKAMSVLGWKPDRKLGFELLQQSSSSKRIRSSMATMMLLAYFTAATSFAPHLYSDVYIKQAMDTLLEAQKHYPNSALYLYFAGRVARLANDLALSTRSFLYAADISKNEWAEVAMVNACRYEIAMNHMLTANWEQAADAFNVLCDQNYWSPPFCRYLQGCCYEMLDRRSDAILAFATVESLLAPVSKKLLASGQGGMPDTDTYAQRKVLAFQQSGYQDLDFYKPALEFLCIWNLLPFVTHELLETYLASVKTALERLQVREKDEYSIRLREFAPEMPLPDHYDQRAALLFIQSALQNALGDHASNIEHLNWIVDHKDKITSESWTVPYAHWEAGIAYWQTDRRDRSRDFWEMSLNYGKFDFEHRLSVRMNLALLRCDDLGFTKPSPPPTPGKRSFSFSK
ncbi:hypothetical protein DM01DRAFT_1148064 [Hesseltinella vesiculosa]|uniref:TPR-like protein n=1 Tax=Hesseltinella vesiculosa TaxID=101127 RepID=A0A1X2G888_9FUNG|nr:hypothetical protein DM01DRAFT_1148064 [Hesseltinella vesiculosa]